MLELFRQGLAELGIQPGGPAVLLGFSGGPDSTCLLHLLVESGIDVVAAHLNHQQRPEAAQDVKHCQTFAEGLGAAFLTGTADVPLLAENFNIGLEEAGRKARYAFFDQAAYQTNCALIATAHTQDDLVETVLFNLARGTGMAGLAGIPERRQNIVRPLLSFTRAQVLDYIKKHELPVLHDPGNDNLDFARVRIRRRILPELETVNPEFRANVARLASLVSEENEFLEGVAAAALEKCERPPNGDLAFLTQDCELVLDRESLAVLPPVVLRRALRLAVTFIGATLDHAQTVSLQRAVQNAETTSVTAEGGKVVVETSSNFVHVRDLEPVEPFRFPLTFPGETVSDVFGWKLIAENWSPTDYERNPGSLEVVLTHDPSAGGLYFRSVQAGDKIRPLGLEGSKLVSDVLNDRKFTLAAKKRLPIICDMAGPVWVPGCCLAERVKITPESRRAVRLRLEPNGPVPGP